MKGSTLGDRAVRERRLSTAPSVEISPRPSDCQRMTPERHPSIPGGIFGHLYPFMRTLGHFRDESKKIGWQRFVSSSVRKNPRPFPLRCKTTAPVLEPRCIVESGCERWASVHSQDEARPEPSLAPERSGGRRPTPSWRTDRPQGSRLIHRGNSAHVPCGKCRGNRPSPGTVNTDRKPWRSADRTSSITCPRTHQPTGRIGRPGRGPRISATRRRFRATPRPLLQRDRPKMP